MRFVLLLVSATVCSLVGCRSEVNYTTSTVDGVLVMFRVSADADITGNTSYVTDEAGNPAGVRHIHTATDSAGVKKECIIEIADSRLTVNGKGYGSIAKGDTVTINDETVKVNEETRVASDN